MAKSKPLGLEWRSSSFFIVSTVGIGLFTDLFLYGLVVPILPFILQDRVHIDPDQIQSNVSGLLAAYAGASVLFSPLAGVIADRTSTRQMPFLAGLAACLLATLLFFLGQTIVVLVLARVLQGMSAAVVWTVGMALVLDTVGPDNLGKTIGSVCQIPSPDNKSSVSWSCIDFWIHFNWRTCFSGSGRGFIQEDWRSWRICSCVWSFASRFCHATLTHRKKECSRV